jgi:hypothetical protein
MPTAPPPPSPVLPVSRGREEGIEQEDKLRKKFGKKNVRKWRKRNVKKVEM